MGEKLGIPLEVGLIIDKELITLLQMKTGLAPARSEEQVIDALIESINFFIRHKMIPFALQGEVKCSTHIRNAKQAITNGNNFTGPG